MVKMPTLQLYRTTIFLAQLHIAASDHLIEGEMYEGKKYPLEKNLTYCFEEFTYIFLPLEIKVSFFKPQKCVFSQLISRNGSFEFIFSVNF